MITLTPEMFGGDNIDGANKAAEQLRLNGGGKLLLSAGEIYEASEPLFLHGNICLDGQGARIISVGDAGSISAYSPPGWNVKSNHGIVCIPHDKGTRCNIIPANRGDLKVQLDCSDDIQNFFVGDYIYLDAGICETDSNEQAAVSINLIRQLDTINGIIYLEYPLEFDFIGATPDFNSPGIMTLADPFIGTIENVIVEAPNIPTKNNALILAVYCSGAGFRNNKFCGGKNSINIYDSDRCFIAGNNRLKHPRENQINNRKLVDGWACTNAIVDNNIDNAWQNGGISFETVNANIKITNNLLGSAHDTVDDETSSALISVTECNGILQIANNSLTVCGPPTIGNNLGIDAPENASINNNQIEIIGTGVRAFSSRIHSQQLHGNMFALAGKGYKIHQTQRMIVDYELQGYTGTTTNLIPLVPFSFMPSAGFLYGYEIIVSAEISEPLYLRFQVDGITQYTIIVYGNIQVDESYGINSPEARSFPANSVIGLQLAGNVNENIDIAVRLLIDA